MTCCHRSQLLGGQTGPAHHHPHLAFQRIDTGSQHSAIAQLEHPQHPAQQVGATTGTVDEDELGVGEGDGQGDTGEPDTGAQVPDPVGGGMELGGEQERVGEMTSLDSFPFPGPDTTGPASFTIEPIPITTHGLHLAPIEVDPGIAGSGEHMFHVKQK